jgi:Flp pilus assembly protein TadG
MNVRRPFRARARSEWGAEIVELAIVTPIFALLIAAMFDFGFLFRNWEVVTNAAREGARMGVLPAFTCDESKPDVQQRVATYMLSSGITDASAYTVDLDTQSIPTPAGTYTACVVHVELEQALPTLGVISALTGGSFSSVMVRSNAVMRTEAQYTPPAP